MTPTLFLGIAVVLLLLGSIALWHLGEGFSIRSQSTATQETPEKSSVPNDGRFGHVVSFSNTKAAKGFQRRQR